MTSDMTPAPEHDYIRSYERAIGQLSQNPQNKDLQHQAVLALARTGALEFAAAEYARYGLDKVHDHEDIMSLAGRLSKDLYLQSTGQKAAAYAQDSAEKYERAFQHTHGYYSGINAATMALMALMAGMPDEVVTERAQAIIDILPSREALTDTDHYFIEATRAESLLLRGDIRYAKLHLKAAIAFDPLNYTAHASTIKQFKMILNKRGQSLDWLAEFMPPRPMHYAGHINLSLSDAEYETLSLSISDHIQKNDIGFGFGALAAGSDILIAETLLKEGGELHLIFPCAADKFLEHSVRPFGADWVPRYHACLEQATSVTVMTYNSPWPDAQVNRLSGQLAMGKAVLRGQYFGVPATQLLIWDQKKSASYTAFHALDWETSGREHIIIPVDGGTSAANASGASQLVSPFILKRSDTDIIERFETVSAAMQSALTAHAKTTNLRIALHVDLPHEASDKILQTILKGSTPQTILISETFACLLALFEDSTYNISFAGLVELEKQNDLRCYALSVA